MNLIDNILDKAIEKKATDVHLANGCYPTYRIQRQLIFDEDFPVLGKDFLYELLDFFGGTVLTLLRDFEIHKQVDFAYTYNGYRFRINVSLAKGIPTFSIRLIPNGEINLGSIGIRELINKMRKVNSGLVLVTGKVNSGKSTTLNAYVQETNKEFNKKIVTIEDPIEYVHESDKSIVIQKEVGAEADIIDYHSALINLLREDADIAVVGEIRDRKTMDVALDLAESGGLVLGTLHTRSCGETIDRIINMYEPSDQQAIKNTLSSVIKLVISQKLVVGKKGGLVLVPEVMNVTPTISAQIRQERFSISEIEDTIHTSKLTGSKSFETSLAELYNQDLIDFKTIKSIMEPDKVELIKGLIINDGGEIIE